MAVESRVLARIDNRSCKDGCTPLRGGLLAVELSRVSGLNKFPASGPSSATIMLCNYTRIHDVDHIIHKPRTSRGFDNVKSSLENPERSLHILTSSLMLLRKKRLLFVRSPVERLHEGWSLRIDVIGKIVPHFILTIVSDEVNGQHFTIQNFSKEV